MNIQSVHLCLLAVIYTIYYQPSVEIYWCLSAGDKVTFLSFLFICNMLRILLLILSRNQQLYLNVIIHSESESESVWVWVWEFVFLGQCVCHGREHEILIEIPLFSIKKMHLKMFANCRPLCLGLNVVMMTSLNGNIFRVTSPLCGKLSGHRLIHWSCVNSPHKDKWHGALVFSLICAWWMNGWVNNR